MPSKKNPSQISSVAEASTRDKVFATARDLFGREGFRCVGVDSIVSASGVAKTSLYRWFPSKDHLIAAVLESHHEEFWVQWESVAAKHEGRPAEELLAQLRWIARFIASPGSRGCPFLNAAAEFPDPSHPARKIVLRNKQLLRRRLLALSMAMGASDATLLSEQLVLLIDGAYASSESLDKAGASRSLVHAGTALVNGAAAAKEIESSR